MDTRNITIIVPAYKPDIKLIGTLEGLIQEGFSNILVIDDGSGTEFSDIFTKVSSYPECILLRHNVNRGKGAALKTAFRYFLDNCHDSIGVVTADADGQHLTKDIYAVSSKMAESGKVVLGVRDFSDPNVPPRSKTGNRITSAVFRIFFGMKISDTQTGLRAFPREYIAKISEADGDRYEFETNMLFLMNKTNIPFTEVKIETVYIEENKSSHFRVIRDSLRIYGLIIKYLLSAVISFIVDAGAFHILNVSGIFKFIPIPSTYIPSFLARVISSLLNYFLNARVVFKDEASKKTLIKYYSLAVFQFLVGASLVALICTLLSLEGWLATLVKILVDVVIYPISFRIQHKWVFNSKK